MKDPPTVPGFWYSTANPYPPVLPLWRRWAKPRTGWWWLWKEPVHKPCSTPT